jgi:serine/threonine-protein kinase
MSTPDPEATARQQSGEEPVAAAPRDGEVQFAPGTIIAGRYRVASILGSGGMGEVYRADDTKLGQAVALKFLPARLARDRVLLARLHDEVRLGRQITHPNVCRIYDIIDWENAHFVSMEYVDGEDLSRLLRRIGRLAHDKAVDIARGIAAGLRAAHVKGILHRDLKPANIMIDSRGDARIMDFGLALGTGEDDGTIAGTPAYMAPEQLRGQPATVQSDLYSLGLVMYELCTGKRAHNARTMPERIREASSEITAPSSVIRDIDPAVERIILRCLSNDPAQRPRSAREVIDALPGGDPLAAALAAGETPSPRVVAAAGSEGSLKPWQAWTLLGTVFFLMTLLFLARSALAPTRYTRVDLPPEVLRQRAKDILNTLGVPPHGDAVHEIISNVRLTAWLAEKKKPGRWAALKNGPSVFRYRLEYGSPPQASPHLPLGVNAPGWTAVEVDAHGRLFFLLRAPAGAQTAKPLDWRPLLDASGVDLSSLRAVAPKTIPAAPFDARAGWTGTYREDETPLLIEAAAWQGTPVYFRVKGDWENATRALARARFGSPTFTFLSNIAFLVVLGVSLLLAWRNLRLRRGDRSGAVRVAVAVFILHGASAVLDQVSASGFASLPANLSPVLGRAAMSALTLFVLYIALEPYARRRWPELLIAWTRLLSGRVRDPLVGRHVLIGLAGGMIHAAFAVGGQLAMRRFVPEAMTPHALGNRALDVAGALGEVAGTVATGIQSACYIMSVLVLLTMLLRNRGLAAAGYFGLTLLYFYLALSHQPDALPAFVIVAAVQAFCAVRYGMLAVAVFQATFFLIFNAPFAPGAAWVTPVAVIPYVVVIAAVAWAFVTSLGGRSPFNVALLDE